ncbi:MAG TPA: TonB-dependent receptor [Dyella sp.]|uniref:TonB-dependent receptor n=1 Tax=Dyella sp. TaxID=1869338 RepID=UPI002CEE1361|nr:TonB-dependent receptor [Dyella sp.]HUB91878.1 TonB-dependent receptor [Dyella sp.]
MILKRNLLVMALASAGLTMAFGVQAATGDNGAQTAPDTAQQTSTANGTNNSNGGSSQSTTNSKSQKELAKSLSTVTVTGFSSSVEKSIDYQRYADTIQNVVTAADIGGLPDQSIADALTRLPGVSAERIAGQASQINCRGLSGNFIETTLDGREQPSTSGSNYIQFDQYPSELINMATVYKSSQASLIEGGVGCTIGMQTANPLENTKDQSLNVDARGSYDGQAHDIVGDNPVGYRASVAYQGKFLDNTLGVGLGFAQLYQPHISEQFVGEAFGGLQSLDPNNPNSRQAYVPEGIQLQQDGGTERRTGYLSTVVWKPTDHLQITGDMYYSKFDNDYYGYGFRSQNFYGNNAVITNPILGVGNTLLGGTVSTNPNQSNVQFSNETTADNYSTHTGVFSGGLNLKWNSGPWHVESDLSLSHAESNEINVDTTADAYTGLGTSNPTLMNQSVTYALNGLNVGSASVANPGVYTNPNDMALSRYGVYPYIYHDRYRAFRTAVQYDLENNPIFTDIQAGVYLNNHTFEANRTVWVYGSEWNSYPVTGEPPLPLSSADTQEVCWKGKFSGLPCFLKLNAPAILAQYGIQPNPQLDLDNNSWSGIQSGTVHEKVRDIFLMGDIDTTLWNHELTGNLGLRVSHTAQASSGIQEVEPGQGVPMTDGFGYVANDFIPINVGMSYTKWLPSMNLIYHWTDSDQTRFSVAKVLSRPPIDSMLAGAGSYITNGQYNVWGGTSPLLRPLTAMQYDLDYEHYFDNSSGLFTAGVFVKHIDTFVQTNVTYNNFDFASVGITVPNNPATGQPYLNGSYTTAYNAQGSMVRGLELSFQKTHFLPGIWSGLGFGANYAFTQSPFGAASTLGGPPQVQALPGLSRNVASAQIFFDNGLFSANLTGNYRSKFVSDSQIAVTNQIVYFAPEMVWDLQTAYNVTKNVSVLFQVLNLTNQPTRTYFGNPSETGTIQYFGRTLYAGFNLKI